MKKIIHYIGLDVHKNSIAWLYLYSSLRFDTNRRSMITQGMLPMASPMK